MNSLFPHDWRMVLQSILHNKHYTDTISAVREAYNSGNVYPPPDVIYRAFEITPFNHVSVVILGQDPYHQKGQAHGLAFSVPNGTRIPPSLQNIFKEVMLDIGSVTHATGDLSPWAAQGVLLLNTTLTVEAHKPASHKLFGWDKFTDHIIQTLSEEKEYLVFMLWGNHAIEKKALIDERKHLILTAPHPSPLSAHRGFLGCRHFSKCNNFLVSHNNTPIIW